MNFAYIFMCIAIHDTVKENGSNIITDDIALAVDNHWPRSSFIGCRRSSNDQINKKQADHNNFHRVAHGDNLSVTENLVQPIDGETSTILTQ